MLEYMDRFIDAELWALLMLDHERQELYYASPDGNQNPKLADLRVKVGEGLAGWVVQHGETLIIPKQPPIPGSPAPPKVSIRRSLRRRPAHSRTQRHPRRTRNLQPRLDKHADYTIAFLHISPTTQPSPSKTPRTSPTPSNSPSPTTPQASTTRLPLRRLERELEISRKDSKALSLVFLDLDRFKAVNDVHGHLVGSELLSRVAKRISELCRSTDLCFRYGGDEFVILMPDTPGKRPSSWRAPSTATSRAPSSPWAKALNCPSAQAPE